MPYNSVAYVREAGGPGELQKHVTDIQGSGLTTVILGMLHIGQPTKYPAQKLGDFIYNDYPANLIVRGGMYNPNNTQAINSWPAQAAKLKQQGSVTNVFLSVGSPPEYWPDFGTMQQMFAEGKADLLKQNLVTLKQAFTVDGVCTIDGFDIDCEESLDQGMQDTVVRFCKMVFELGFRVTFCPYQTGQESWWQGCMKTLWDQGHKVSWWNLQCYSGGGSNLYDLSPWISALGAVVGAQAASSYLVPGLCVAGEDDVDPTDQRCPFGLGGVEPTTHGWSNPNLGGAFLWRYDALPAHPELCSNQNNLANYVKAINSGLSKT